MDYDMLPLPKQNNLHFIAKGIKIPGFYKIVGQFTSVDGDRVKVLPKYFEKMKEYARLYEEFFEKEVEIISDPYAKQGSACFW